NVADLVMLADDWRATGGEIVDTARELADALDRLMDFWSGNAAEQARTAVALNAQWVSDLGATATEMGAPIDDAAGALRSVQNAMPGVTAQITPAAVPADAATASALAGPMGAAIAGTSAASASAFTAQTAQVVQKSEAVDAM